MYKFYIGEELLPVAPESLNIKIKGQNKTYNLINEGEINVLKSAGLTDIDFEVLLPNSKYSFASYPNGFQKAEYYLNIIKTYKASKETFQFIVTRTLPNGDVLFNTNFTVSVEDYTIKESVDNGCDVMLSVSLKQYKPFATKAVVIAQTTGRTTRIVDAQTPTGKKGGTYTVKSGDCLYNIAKKMYGNGADYKKIYNANKDKIKNPNLIYPNQVLTIP